MKSKLAATEEIPATNASMNELFDRLWKSERETIFLLLLQPNLYSGFISELPEVLSDKKDVQCVYVTITLPYHELAPMFSSKEGSSRKILFIDAITKGTVGTENADDCIFVDGPSELIQLSSTLEKLIKQFGTQKTFVLIDSLTVLLVHNSKDLIMKFLHHIISKLRSYKCKVIFLALNEKEHQTPLNFLSFLSDETFQLIKPVLEENCR